MSTVEHRAGFVTLVGRPNVGKSTLLNRLVGMKLAAVAGKPQTTRNRIVGIVTRPEAQLVFVDTPGLHKPRDPMNARMVATTRQALHDTDLTVLVLDAYAGIGDGDRRVAHDLATKRGTMLVVTKIDLVGKHDLLKTCAEAAALIPDADVIPLSGATGENIDALFECAIRALPPSPPLYPADQVTEQTERFLVTEVVREKLIAALRDELPYATAVMIDTFEELPERKLLRIEATILVERDSQKGIVIGAHGKGIRDVGSAARLALEEIFACRVYLGLAVKTQHGWSRNPRVLRDLGV